MKNGIRASRLFVGIMFLAAASACSDGDDEGACAAGLERCATECVDLSSDAANCGACGTACEPGALCQDGVCTVECEGGRSRCGDDCVDLGADVDHCGDCGLACGEGESCVEGICVAVCGPEERFCDGGCVNPDSDPAHCGGCDRACEDGWVCLDGTCACPEGKRACGGICVDVSSDGANCGDCGIACGAEQACIEGSCACPGGLSYCDGACVDTNEDLLHCGACDAVCGGQPQSTGGVCSEGSCVLTCEEGWADCDGDRLSGCESFLATDERNCGGCGTVCADLPGVAESLGCADGHCLLLCEDGVGDCDEDPLNGCETDLNGDVKHCGACNNDCRALAHVAEASCTEGACGVVTCNEGFEDCNGDPVDGCEASLQDDPQNCGACGTVCPLGCSEGECVGPVEVVTGSGHTCAILSNRELWCWGSNSSGQLGIAANQGNPRPNLMAIPTRVDKLESVRAVAATFRHTCAIDGNGQVHCWGRNLYGQLGTDPSADSYSPAPVQELPPAIQVATGDDHSCALTEDGEVWCWGSNGYKQLGNDGPNTAVPARVEALVGLNVYELRAGVNHTCVVAEDPHDPGRKVLCWGNGSDGILGNGETTTSSTPVGPAESFWRVVSGGFHNCALTQGGNVKCWGSNFSGQLGAGLPTHQTSNPNPVAVKDLGAVSFLASGRTTVCAIDGESDVWCWGSNSYGNMGEDTGFFATHPEPIRMGTLSDLDLERISVGHSHGCGIRNRTLWCWGFNLNGELGRGTFGGQDAHAPAEVVWE